MRPIGNTYVSSKRGFKQSCTLSVLLLAGDIQSRTAVENAARVCAGVNQQLEALGAAVLGGNVNRKNAVLIALVDVDARSQQQLEALGVAVLGGNVNRRNAVVVALVDVANDVP